MSNMTYCMFQNTLADLNDCLERMDEDVTGNLQNELSPEELNAMRRLIKVCKTISENYN